MVYKPQFLHSIQIIHVFLENRNDRKNISPSAWFSNLISCFTSISVMKDTDSVHHHTLYILLHMIYYVMFFELQMVTRSFLRFPYRNFFFAPISVVYGTSETLTGANHGRYPLIILDLSLVHHLGCNIFVFTWSKLDFSVPRGAILGKLRILFW